MNVTKNVKFEKEANEDKGSTSQAMATEDKTTKIALTLAKDAITAAVKSAEEAENPVKNIDWITHGEFTEEKGRQQVEEFVLDTPIDVSYVFEGHSLVHRPGEIRFREKWLRDIIEAKYVLMNPNIFQFNSIGIFQNILGDF
uniref:A-kinase anchoring protein 14 n=3 Tax=Bos TaxID=9903 RepID=A0ABI0NKQ5_BOVIN